jgi:glutamine synthetase
MGDLALNHILPSAVSYQNQLIKNIKGLKEVGIDAPLYRSQGNILREISEHIQAVHENVCAMVEARKVVNKITDTREKAISYCNEVKDKYFDKIRYHVDKLEHLVNDEDWTLPKYRELLFLR